MTIGKQPQPPLPVCLEGKPKTISQHLSETGIILQRAVEQLWFWDAWATNGRFLLWEQLLRMRIRG